MFARISERRMHVVRWILTVAWLVIIGSLFYDPWTPALTTPDLAWSPFRLTDSCIAVQGKCLSEQPYSLTPTLFWGAIVPSAIFILLVFGHELWRRICPLAFLSQIPRALGWQRQHKKTGNGKVRSELAKIKFDSWLGRNYPYLQFGWLFVGLCGRILFFNADRAILAGWLISTIIIAIAVGYLYGGKSWCNYFCPMAPVQKIYSLPSGLLGSKAHTDVQPITQSMCRTVLPDGQEQSACVACQNPCIDIDAERAYWHHLDQPREAGLRYSYIGLVIGYFVYYYLYAGNWEYYFSGAWARQTDQLATLLNPGLYFGGQAINIPKLVAVPLTLGFCTLLGYQGGRWIENRAKAYGRKHAPLISPSMIVHRLFVLSTFGVFNFFFIFGGRPIVQLLPIWIQYFYDLSLVLLSTLWAYRTWQRHPDLYARENLASRFRKQLAKLQLDLAPLLENRSLNDLNIHEVYILARVLPGLTRQKRRDAYQGVVKEALQEGYVNYSSSLGVLQQLRQELGITDDEHQEVLEALGIEDPELLNPDRQRSLENQIRLSGYQKSLERLMLIQKQQKSTNTFLAQNSPEISQLRQQYSITPQEEAWVAGEISSEVGYLRQAEFLLTQLPALTGYDLALDRPIVQEHEAVLLLLKDHLRHKTESILRNLLEILVKLADNPAAIHISEQIAVHSSLLPEILATDSWSQRLAPKVWHQINMPNRHVDYLSKLSPAETLETLELLAADRHTLIQAACLYLIAQFDLKYSQSIAARYQHSTKVWQETARLILAAPQTGLPLDLFPLLEKAIYLANSDFFYRMHGETLLALADRATIKTYEQNQVITAAGDTCRELLLLIAGAAQVHHHPLSQPPTNLQIGQTLDELEVLTHSSSQNTIIASVDQTRILAVPVAAFDDWLKLDRDFAQRVLTLESRHLQRLMQSAREQ
jgi:hypothetical protein